MQVYRTPFRSAWPRPDSDWERWSADLSDDYTAYRDVIDALIETMAHEHCCVGAHGLKVLEVCGGDGTLADRLLRSSMPIATYRILERNGNLAQRARTRLAPHRQATVVMADASVADEYACIEANEHACVDEHEGMGASGTFDLCISSGSILNGQVGTPEMARACLSAISDSLTVGGLLIATGFSATFLHPAMMRREGLDVVLRGSLPATQSATAPSAGTADAKELTGIEHAWGRFQCLVLCKRLCDISNESKGVHVGSYGHDVLFSALANDAS